MKEKWHSGFPPAAVSQLEVTRPSVDSWTLQGLVACMGEGEKLLSGNCTRQMIHLRQ